MSQSRTVDTHPHDRRGSHPWRWEPAANPPAASTVLRQLALRALLPGLVVFALIVGLGKLIMGPLGELQAEEPWSKQAEQARTPIFVTLTHLWSSSTDTWMTIGTGIAASLLVWFLTRRWWVGIVPVLAITLESSIFVAATHIVGRPRPEVSRPDEAPPTSSFPSGHAAAAMALWLSIALLAARIERAWLRRTIMTIGVVLPILVAFARFYRGAHHVSDIVVGVLLGIFCAWTATHAVTATRQAPYEREPEHPRGA